jgi:hypothetical protein
LHGEGLLRACLRQRRLIVPVVTAAAAIPDHEGCQTVLSSLL